MRGEQDDRIRISKLQKFRGHQGEDTQRENRKQILKNREKNTLEEASNNPEDKEIKSVEIPDVLLRLVRQDKKRNDLLSTERYLKWLTEKIDQYFNDGVRVTFDTECEMKFVRSSGAGGQNVNKVNTACSLRHEYLGIRIKKADDRNQAKNRSDAETGMSQLVNNHVEKWAELVVDDKEDWKQIIAKKIVKEFEGLIARGEISGKKRIALTVACKKGLNLR